MADTVTATIEPPLGVGAIVSESFSILFRHLGKVMILALVPTLFGIVVSGLLNGWGYALGVPDPNLTAFPSVAAIVLDLIIQMVVYGVATALLIQLAYDAKLGRNAALSSYIGPAMAAALPIAVLVTIAGILSMLGSVALILPGLWIYAVYSMVSPSIVIEKAGYRAMGRSVDLTRGYRWPIVGAVVIVWICAALIGGAIGFVVAMVGSAVGGGLLVSLILVSLASAFGAGLGGISLSLIYARLREIKEGVSVDQIAAVFD